MLTLYVLFFCWTKSPQVKCDVLRTRPGTTRAGRHPSSEANAGAKGEVEKRGLTRGVGGGSRASSPASSRCCFNGVRWAGDQCVGLVIPDFLQAVAPGRTSQGPD